MHEAKLTGLPQHCTREALSLDITMWTTELILPRHSGQGQLYIPPTLLPRGHTLPLLPEMCLCTILLLETFTLNMNSLNNKWKLSEIAH